MTGSTPQNGENKPPQAIVKPQVLTHVIEGFVIQEGAEPFPVCVSAPVSALLGTQRDKQPTARLTLQSVVACGEPSDGNTHPVLLLLLVAAHSFCLIQSLIIVR